MITDDFLPIDEYSMASWRELLEKSPDVKEELELPDMWNEDTRAKIDIESQSWSTKRKAQFGAFIALVRTVSNQKRNNIIEKTRIELPVKGKLISTFAEEVVKVLKDKNRMFFRSDSHEIVEITAIKQKKDEKECFTGFLAIRPQRFITLLEEYIVPYTTYKNNHGSDYEIEKSMGSDLANTVLNSPILENNLPLINRIFTIPIPIIYQDKLTFPKSGYDARFNSWLVQDAPKMTDENMLIDEAKNILSDLFSEFCFKSDHDKNNAISALLTPYLRGLFTSFNVRTPVFVYLANRERAGKDYLAGITGIVYEGYALEDAPISTADNMKGNNTEEFEKIFMSALVGGRKRMHFANNKGYINNANFEAAITNKKHSGRILGRNELKIFDNEMDFSLSGNIGVGYTPDLANRCRFINLFLDIEDANTRQFKNPNLHLWVEQNRGLIISALFAFVRNWIEKNKLKGSLPFSSFSEWANICGGIMEAAGYANPCTQDNESAGIGGDSETSDMKQLFELCFEKYPEKYLSKQEIREVIQFDENGLFHYFDLTKKSDQIKFGLKIIKYAGRVLSDIRMVVDNPSQRASRQKYMFSKNKQSSLNDVKVVTYCGNVGNVGNLIAPEKVENIIGTVEWKPYQTLPTLPTRLKTWVANMREFSWMDVLDAFFDEAESKIEEIINEMKRNGELMEIRAGFFKVV